MFDDHKMREYLSLIFLTICTFKQNIKKVGYCQNALRVMQV